MRFDQSPNIIKNLTKCLVRFDVFGQTFGQTPKFGFGHLVKFDDLVKYLVICDKSNQRSAGRRPSEARADIRPGRKQKQKIIDLISHKK